MKDADEADAKLPHRLRRDLRLEARSTAHLMTHVPRNPYCEACVRAKMTQERRFRGSYVNTAQYWGHELTGDHITSMKDSMLGISGDRDAFVVQDMYSRLINLYPTRTKHAHETAMKFR